MKQFLLSLYHPEGGPPPGVDLAKVMREVDALNADLQQQGAFVFAGGLEPTSSAFVLRNGGADRTEGPYRSADEPMGGCWIIKVADRRAALAWAERAAAATGLPVEARAFQEDAD